MSQQTASTEKEKSFMNVNETGNSNSGYKETERLAIEGTPFTMIIRNTMTKKEYYIAIGNIRLNPEILESEQDVHRYIEKNHWNITQQLFVIMMQNMLAMDYDLTPKEK